MGDLGNQVSQFESSAVQQNGDNSRVQPRSVNPNDRGNSAQQEMNNYLGIAISPQLKQESQYNPVNQVIIMQQQQQQLHQHQDQQQQQQQKQQQPQMHGISAQMSQNDAANSNTSKIHFQHMQHPTQPQVPQNIHIQSLTNGTMPPPQNVPVGGSMQVQVAQKGRFSIIKDVTQQPSDASNTNGMAMTMDDGSIHVQIQQQQQNQGMPSHGSIVSVMSHQHSVQQQQHQQQQQQHQQQQHQQQQHQQKSISQISAISRGATSASVPSSRVIKSVMSSPPASGLEVKGRFLVTKSKDGHSGQNHVRSHSMGATPEQYQQSMAGVLSVNTNMQQQIQHPIAIPQHQQMNHARSLSDGQLLQIPIGQSPAGLNTLNSGLPVVYSTPTKADNCPLIPPMSSKPPKIPTPMTATSNTPGGSGVSGGVGKMFHFLDQLKIEVVEADKMVKSLKGDVKFLVSSQSAILGLRYSIRYGSSCRCQD